METIIAIIIILLIVTLALVKIYKEKKRGAKCIGCASYKSCNSKDKR